MYKNRPQADCSFHRAHVSSYQEVEGVQREVLKSLSGGKKRIILGEIQKCSLEQLKSNVVHLSQRPFIEG